VEFDNDLADGEFGAGGGGGGERLCEGVEGGESIVFAIFAVNFEDVAVTKLAPSSTILDGKGEGMLNFW